MRAAELPDDLEMILEDHRLGVSAALFLVVRISFVLMQRVFCRLLPRHFGPISQLVLTK
jgi:hypothetical protein